MEKYYYIVTENGYVQTLEKDMSKKDIQKILKDAYQCVADEDKIYQPLEDVLEDLKLSYYNELGQHIVLQGIKQD
jgi:hypothetical protein